MASVTLSMATPTNETGVGTIAHLNPGNAANSDDTRTTATVTAGATTNFLQSVGTPGTAIGSDKEIVGIVATIEGNCNTDATMLDEQVELTDGSSVIGVDNARGESLNVSTDTTKTYGSPASHWGSLTDITPAIVNAGLTIRAAWRNSSAGSRACRIDQHGPIVVHTRVRADPRAHLSSGSDIGALMTQIVNGVSAFTADAGVLTLATSQSSPEPANCMVAGLNNVDAWYSGVDGVYAQFEIAALDGSVEGCGLYMLCGGTIFDRGLCVTAHGAIGGVRIKEQNGDGSVTNASHVTNTGAASVFNPEVGDYLRAEIIGKRLAVYARKGGAGAWLPLRHSGGSYFQTISTLGRSGKCGVYFPHDSEGTAIQNFSCGPLAQFTYFTQLDLGTSGHTGRVNRVRR